jgi:xanthine dehydrogenase YagR molybdenum-binding subunit
MTLTTRAIGAALSRVDGPEKVTGAARYAFEHRPGDAAYAFAVQSTIARGRIAEIDPSPAIALPGVLTVLTHVNAPRLANPQGDLAVLQSDAVAYHGQVVALVVAETPEVARHAAGLVRLEYDAQPPRVHLSADDPALYAPDHIMPQNVTDTFAGDADAALAAAPVTIDHTYTTPNEHNQPMEPHACVATWTADGVTIHDANQGSHTIRNKVAEVFGLEPERVHVTAPYVGGGFGSKVFVHPHLIAAVMASQAVERPVKLALTRQQMFSLAGHRTPTIQRVQLGAERDGRLTAIAHDVVEHTATIEEFAEQTALATRMMYAAPHRRTTHRLAALDVPVPSIMRAPGEAPGMYGLEAAMDELAIACGIDPIELRIRNEPEVDPESGLPFSSRGLVECLREGARRFGWREPPRRDGRWLVGSGVAASTYPARRRPATATAHADADGGYLVRLDAIDIGTGAWTVLTQIAADALEAPLERVRVEIGDSALPAAGGAGGSMGTASWGSAIVEAGRALRALIDERGGAVPDEGLEATGEAGANPLAERYSMHSFGAQFAEVQVDADTGEVRVPRLLGVFGVGTMINPKTGRSQLIGGMTMGLSMALHEEAVIDARFGHYANHDFAEYHIAANADVQELDAVWIEEDDPHVNAMGAKGIGEVGITGTAAAIANAVHHATGVRVRDLPIRPDRVLEGLA